MRKFKFTSFVYPLCSGILLTLTTPMFNVWPLLMIALIPYFLFVFSTSRFLRLLFGTLILVVPYCLVDGAPFFQITGTWWTRGSEIFGVPTMVAYPIVVFSIVFISSLFYLFPVTIYTKIRKTPEYSSIIFALLWAIVEYFRSIFYFGGYTFGTIGYALIETTYIKHFAVIFGVFGLSFLAVLFSAWSARIIIRIIYEKGRIFERVRQAFFSKDLAKESIFVSILFSLIFLFGIAREIKGPPTVQNMRVAVIASTLKTETSISEESYWLYDGLISEAFKKLPDIIVLPENVFPYFIINESTNSIVDNPIIYLPNAKELLSDFVEKTKKYPDVTIAIPTHTVDDGKTYNSIIFYKNGKISGVYHKRVLVPFTEYAPLGLSISLFERISKGELRQSILINGEQFDAAICSEIDHIPFRTHGAKFIISPSNDSALNGNEVIRMHDRDARMRSIESGVYMFRSTRGGISSIIDPYGYTILSAQDTNTVLVADIP